MAGLHHTIDYIYIIYDHTYLLIVFAAKPFPYLMLSAAHKVAFPIIRHTDVRDLTEKLMSEAGLSRYSS